LMREVMRPCGLILLDHFEGARKKTKGARRYAQKRRGGERGGGKDLGPIGFAHQNTGKRQKGTHPRGKKKRGEKREGWIGTKIGPGK